MHATILNITFDCADARAQAMFWSAVTGWPARQQDATPGHIEYAVTPVTMAPDTVAPDTVAPVPVAGPRLYFTTVPEPKLAKNRIHLDLIPPGDDQQIELARLTSLGATVLDDQPTGAAWIILADPEGNEFCLEG